MKLRGLLTAASLAATLVAGAAAWAQVRIEGPRVDLDIPERRPDPRTGADMVELVGGLFALKDGYDRSRRGYICVLTYEDRNGNGRRDRGEGPLPGWNFAIADAAGATVAQGQTGKEGRFCNETPLDPGAYSVRQSPGGGWTNTEPGAPSVNVKQVTLPAEQSVTVLFGNCRGDGCARERRDDRRDERRAETRAGPVDPTPQGSFPPVCVEKFNDLNGDGVRQPTEGWLMGWNFEVTMVPTTWGTITVPVTTGHEGRACVTIPLALVGPGPGQVKEPLSQPAALGWAPTTPGGAIQTINVAPGQTVTVTFGNRQATPQTGEVCVHKYEDLDQDSTRDPNEPPLAGWRFNLSHGLSGETREDGVICWVAPLGGYTVTETLQPGWTSTDPGGTSPSKTVYVTAGQTAHVFFGNRRIPPPPGDICVTKYQDLDADGVRDPGEPPLAGWTFTLSSGQSGVTGPEGRVCFTVPEGEYTVTETMQPGWVSSDPGGPNPSKPVKVIAGETAKPFFGNRRIEPGKVCIVKYNDLNHNAVHDAGEPELPGWTFTLYAGPNSGGAQVTQVTTGPRGSICRELPPGTYSAYETMQAGWANSDPPGPPLHKTFTVPPGDMVTIVFGNYQPPKLRFTKVVNSTAPSGGFPTTGLVGGMFQIVHHCVLGNQSGGNSTSLSAGQTAPLAGYTGASVGALCTVTETLPPGPIAFADCPSGTGHWETPVITTTPFTVVGGWNDTTVTNRFVCDVPPPRLSIQKIDDSAPGACGPNGLNNPCVFRIRITNIGTGTYAGPVTFSDSMRVLSLPPAANSMSLLSVGPAGWTCSPTGAPMTCTGPVNLTAGQFVDVAVSFNFGHPVRPTRNCVTMTAPVALPEVCLTL